MLDNAVEELAPVVGRCRACKIMGRSRASHYRRNRPPECAREPVQGPPPPRPALLWELSDTERATILEVLNSDEFADLAPRQVYGRLLDQGRYLCSVSTMYRILRANHMVTERRAQARRVSRKPPRLRATGPNQVWTWDITFMRGPYGENYRAYVILDIYSRFVVGWVIARREDSDLAAELIRRCCEHQGINPDQLHADRGAAMTSNTVAMLLVQLGIGKSHSRPRTSNDNPYSEAQFKTVKHHHTYPKDGFTSIEHARRWLNDFINYYNHEHYHTGIGLMTPATIHYGQAETVITRRQTVLDDAYQANPERFTNKPPQAPRHPTQAWINKPPQPPSTQPTTKAKSVSNP
ncbi:MAG: IS3 family transposase [Acidimicrobiales bacterium]|nr:IS3 family transposase [Acidimicrobiales bacterium]